MAKTEAGMTGDFHIEISEDKTEVFLVFSSGTETDKLWSIQDLAGLFAAANINAVKAEELGKILEPFQKKPQKSFRVSVLKTSLPIAPVSESIALGDFPVPPAWKDLIKAAIDQAPPPTILVDVQEKVEKEQTVVKKGPLPFMAGKAETVTVVEKVIRQEAFAVDSTVVGHAWVPSAQRIGSINLAKPGTPGKAVTGEILQPEIMENSRFHCGSHIKRKGIELTVELAGILRWGTNWIDLIPFADHSWELTLSTDKATCFVDFRPGSKQLPIPQANLILEAALTRGFKTDELITLDELQALVNEAVDLQQAFHHSLSQARNASFEIIVSEDKLKAVLNAEKGSGHGKALVLKDLGKAINESGLKFNKERIKVEIPAWFNGPDKNLVGFILAEGQPAKDAPSQTASFAAEFKTGKELEAQKKQLEGIVLPETLAHFPKSKITGIATVDKEQRVVTLGPQAVGGPGADVYGQVIPGVPGAPFEVQLFGFLEQMGSSLIVAKRAGLLLMAEDQGKTYLACIEHLDGEIIIELAEGNMAAYITINAHRGSGKALKQTDIMAEITKLGIKRGIEAELLDRIIHSSENETDVQHVCFARGQAPMPGGASEIKWKIEFASGQGVRLRQDGTADFRNQDKITTVKKDTLIAEIMPADLVATAGWDVLGKDLAAPSSAQSPIEIGANIRQQAEPDGRTLLFADQEGELRREKNRLEIVSAFTIKGNIDSVTGNIKFPGAVQVGGDVMAGFYIVAGGEIKIGGSIEGSLLSTDEDILIMGGVKGGGKAMLRTKKTIMASFIEQATVMAVGDIKIKKALLRSHVKCNSHIIMADDGKLIGGEIKTKLGLMVGDLGNPSGIPTRVIFGQDVLIEDQIAVEEKEIKKLQDDMAKIAAALVSAERIHDPDKKQELFVEKVKLMKMMEKRNLRLFTLKERYEQHFESEIIIKGTVYPGVVIESHGRTHEFATSVKGVKFTFDTASGRINELSLSAPKA